MTHPRLSKINPSFFTIKEGSTFLTKPLFPQGREDVTALRCSEPLRSKVGGPSKVFAILCGMGPLGYNLPIYYLIFRIIHYLQIRDNLFCFMIQSIHFILFYLYIRDENQNKIQILVLFILQNRLKSN